MTFGGIFIDRGLQEVIIPAIWEQKTFDDKVGPENSQMMWRFEDKGERKVCLIPEVTGIIQEMWRNEWVKTMPKPTKLFYITRCYRYERPQKGRYREFTQAGIEILGGTSPFDYQESVDLLRGLLTDLNVDFVFNSSVKRGLSYYTEDGFEASVEGLGAQKQVAGGGRYAEGIGWAVGVERLVLARNL